MCMPKFVDAMQFPCKNSDHWNCVSKFFSSFCTLFNVIDFGALL
jgi:hypothetical protein